YAISQQSPRPAFEDLSHDGCRRLGCSNSHIQMKPRRLQDDLPARRHTAKPGHQGLPPAVKEDRRDKGLVSRYIFDDLKLEEFRTGAIWKFQKVFIKHRAEWIDGDTGDYG